MFAGHVGVALALGRADRRINVGVLVAASLLLDLLLWLLVLVGWESVAIPDHFARTHQPEFAFPYSHGLAASVAWSLVAAALAWTASTRPRPQRTRAATLVAAAVFSHWLLDAVVHRPELPLAGADSARVGLALWDRMPLALGIEAAIVVAGVALFVPGSGLSRARAIALVLLSLAILAFTVLGMTAAPPPPSALAMAGSSLATVVAVCLLVAWIVRSARR